jgi:hypothetical protein
LLCSDDGSTTLILGMLLTVCPLWYPSCGSTPSS